MVQMLLHGRPCLLRDLGQLTLALLADHFKRSYGMDVRIDRGPYKGLVKFRARLLLQFLTDGLTLAIDDLAVDLHELLHSPSAATSKSRSSSPSTKAIYRSTCTGRRCSTG